MNEETKTSILMDSSFSQPKASRIEFCLVILSGGELGKQILLDRDSLSIGRSNRADLAFKEVPSLSRIHAVINREGNGHSIKDDDSLNGTFVNNETIHRKFLEDGDVIRVGTVILKYMSSANMDELTYHEKIKELREIDALTQIANKGAFDQKLNIEMNSAYKGENKGTPLSLVLFDVDFFKKVNDQYGHLAGDYVLSRLANTVASSLPAHFFIARYGGEEFAIIMPGTDKPEAVEFAERVRELVEQTSFEYDGQLLPIRISMGVSETSYEISLSRDDFIEKADAALYKAKRNGRNQVVASF